MPYPKLSVQILWLDDWRQTPAADAALIPQRWSDLWHRLQLEGTPAAMVALLGLTQWCYTMARRMILIGTKLKQYTHHLQLVYNDCKMPKCSGV